MRFVCFACLISLLGCSSDTRPETDAASDTRDAASDVTVDITEDAAADTDGTDAAEDTSGDSSVGDSGGEDTGSDDSGGEDSGGEDSGGEDSGGEDTGPDATDAGDAGDTCRSNETCVRPTVCSLFVPSYPCGGAPPPRECEPGATGLGGCPDGRVCFENCGGTFCVPDCLTAGTACEGGQVCGDERYCRPPDCRLGERVDCPAQFECAPRGESGDENGCRRVRCDEDAECDGGICAEGQCYAGEGSCVRDPGPPP